MKGPEWLPGRMMSRCLGYQVTRSRVPPRPWIAQYMGDVLGSCQSPSKARAVCEADWLRRNSCDECGEVVEYLERWNASDGHSIRSGHRGCLGV